jgi:hypothetical protein
VLQDVALTGCRYKDDDSDQYLQHIQTSKTRVFSVFLKDVISTVRSGTITPHGMESDAARIRHSDLPVTAPSLGGIPFI